MPNTEKERLDALLKRVQKRRDMERNRSIRISEGAKEAERIQK